MSMSDDSQELVQMNDSQQLVDEMNDSQELVDEIDDLQEPVDDEWVVEIEGRLENPEISIRASMDSNIEEYPSIFGDWKHWDDFGASFIPETKKWQLVACMKHWFGLNLKSYHEYMQGNVDRAWSYYYVVDEQFHTIENSKRFIEHLLVSSCFLILVMVIFKKEGYREVILDEIANQSRFPKGTIYEYFENLFNFLKGDIAKMQCYMITMNYQIPWFVLEAVYTELSNTSKLLDIPIHKLALTFLPTYPIEHPSKVDGGTIPEDGFKHLLHIYHWSRTPDSRKYLINGSNKLIGHFHIPRVTELQLSQTVFVKDEGGSIDVLYSDTWRISRVMQLTPLHVLEYSTILYESLLIFEGDYGFICGYPFTAYVACMACFLKSEADVRVLREIGVIPSTTFDDKDVLCFVQEIKTSIRGNLCMPNELSFLEEKVMAHHKKSGYRVIGEFKKRYCSNTWIILSVIAGILLFALTFIQTLYGTLSYYKQ